MSFYHFTLAELAALFYFYPTRRMIVVGVTGTKGKSSTAYLIAKILEGAGYKVGLTSTVLFKIGGREWLNPYKMTMLGRFKLQGILNKMAREGVEYAVVETSSEGILQHRHRGIGYDVAVFTNLSPEHLEAHGSYQNYRAAKAELFKNLKKKKINGRAIPRVIVANADDEEGEFFLSFPADDKYAFSLENKRASEAGAVLAKEIAIGEGGSHFKVDGEGFELKLIGRFNVYNALAAISVGVSQSIELAKMSEALKAVCAIPGRFEFIDVGQPFKIIVDYAHEPKSMEELYAAINLVSHKRVLHVFGATGGGRDKAKRPVLGAIAARGADAVIVTNDDPYSEDQNAIADQVIAGVRGVSSEIFCEKILDRREAIHRALDLAQNDDVVLITGKGAEQKMALGRKKIPWDDRRIIKEELKKIF